MSPSDPVRILQLSDTHLFADPDQLQGGVNVRDRLTRTLAAMQPWAAHAQALLHTGDLVHDESPAGYDDLAGQLTALGLPGRVIPGNHDDPRAMARAFAGPLITTERRLVVGDWTVIMLNTQIPGAVPGALSDDELAALDEAIETLTTHHALVAMHHPPMPVGTPWLDAIALQRPAALQARIEAEPRIRGVLVGHIHHPVDQRWCGRRVISAPSTAVDFCPGAADFTRGDAPPGFRWLDLGPAGDIDTGVVWADHG
jgi:Icc protein